MLGQFNLYYMHCQQSRYLDWYNAHIHLHLQVQEAMMQGGKGWNKDVLGLPSCGAELSSAGTLVWCVPRPTLHDAQLGRHHMSA